MGHCASKCPKKKKRKIKKYTIAFAIVDEFVTKSEQDFSLVSIDSSVGFSSFEHVHLIALR